MDVEGVVKSFAELYYKESYYPEIKTMYSDNYIKRLEQDQQNGIKLNLRQIVNIFEDVDAANFYGDGVYCSFVKTYALIYPQFPYDINDYKIEVVTSCEKEM